MSENPNQGARPRPYRLAELGLLILAIAVSTIAYALVGLGTEDTIPANVYEYAAWLAALGLILHVVVWWKAKYADPVLVPIAVLLNGLGLAMIYRVDLGRPEYLRQRDDAADLDDVGRSAGRRRSRFPQGPSDAAALHLYSLASQRWSCSCSR